MHLHESRSYKSLLGQDLGVYCDHMMHMRVVELPYKILLMCQILISMTICILNASLTAGSSNFVDILLNAVGLMILNDLDNIVGSIYIHVAGLGVNELPE